MLRTAARHATLRIGPHLVAAGPVFLFVAMLQAVVHAFHPSISCVASTYFSIFSVFFHFSF
jgi:hypothetical protein